MSNLIDLDHYRNSQACKRGFAPWSRQFKESYQKETKFVDLSNSTIGYLAAPGEKSAFIFYQLIMGVLNLGSALKLEYLKPADRLRVVDTHLFLSDLVRYEMMRRIEWIDSYNKKDQSLLQLIVDYSESDYYRYTDPPLLLETHPEYDSFIQKIPREREVMIRQLFPDALITFKKKFS